MNAHQQYRLFIETRLKPILLERGYKRRRFFFYKTQDKDWAAVYLQRSAISKKSRPDAIVFTVALSFFSFHLCNFYGKGSCDVPPLVSNAQWGKRLGFLLPVPQDWWWYITGTRSDVGFSLQEHILNAQKAGLFSNYLRIDEGGSPLTTALIEHGLPFLDELLRPGGFLKQLKSEFDQGRLSVEHCVSLAALLKNERDSAAYLSVLDHIRLVTAAGKPIPFVAQYAKLLQRD